LLTSLKPLLFCLSTDGRLNAGLIYFEIKNYYKALVQAHTALAMGLPRTELRDRLQSVGKWTEPVTNATPPTDAVSKPDSELSK
jgi:hypothetical protein